MFCIIHHFSVKTGANYTHHITFCNYMHLFIRLKDFLCYQIQLLQSKMLIIFKQ